MEEESKRIAAEYRAMPLLTSEQLRKLPPQMRPGWRSDSGAIEWSFHPGKILSVR